MILKTTGPEFMRMCCAKGLRLASRNLATSDAAFAFADCCWLGLAWLAAGCVEEDLSTSRQARPSERARRASAADSEGTPRRQSSCRLVRSRSLFGTAAVTLFERAHSSFFLFDASAFSPAPSPLTSGPRPARLSSSSRYPLGVCTHATGSRAPVSGFTATTGRTPSEGVSIEEMHSISGNSH